MDEIAKEYDVIVLGTGTAPPLDLTAGCPALWGFAAVPGHIFSLTVDFGVQV